jgi:hypothetical protein
MTSQLALDLPGDDQFEVVLQHRRKELVRLQGQIRKDLESDHKSAIYHRNRLYSNMAQLKAIDVLLTGLKSEKQAKSA